MQIRIRSGHLEFLRATWDKEAKRTRQKLIKQVDFTPEEQQQYDEWKKEQSERLDETSYKNSCELLNTHIEHAIKGLELGAWPMQKTETHDWIGKLQRALKKAGVARPPKVDKIRETKTGSLDL